MKKILNKLNIKYLNTYKIEIKTVNKSVLINIILENIIV
jgi:hypothetical protein